MTANQQAIRFACWAKITCPMALAYCAETIVWAEYTDAILRYELRAAGAPAGKARFRMVLPMQS
jgi:hypothetical protein